MPVGCVDGSKIVQKSDTALRGCRTLDGLRHAGIPGIAAIELWTGISVDPA